MHLEVKKDKKQDQALKDTLFLKSFHNSILALSLKKGEKNITYAHIRGIRKVPQKCHVLFEWTLTEINRIKLNFTPDAFILTILNLSLSSPIIVNNGASLYSNFFHHWPSLASPKLPILHLACQTTSLKMGWLVVLDKA